MSEGNDSSLLTAVERPVDVKCRCVDSRHLGTSCEVYNNCLSCEDGETVEQHGIAAKCPLPLRETEEKKRVEEQAKREEAVDEKISRRLARAEKIVDEKFARPHQFWKISMDDRSQCYTDCVPGQCSPAEDGKTRHTYFGYHSEDHRAAAIKAMSQLVPKIYDELKAEEEKSEGGGLPYRYKEALRIYDDVWMFNDGSLAARARGNNMWFHVREDGLPLYDGRFRSVWPFVDGKAKVECGGRKYYIRPDGTEIK